MSIEEYGRDEFSRQSFYRYQYSADEGKTWTMTDDDTYSYKFDSKGNLISIESKDNINDAVMGVEYEYNDSNICVLESDYAVEEETKIYFEKRIYDYKQEDNYRTETTTAYYIEGDEEEFVYKDIYFYFV